MLIVIESNNMEGLLFHGSEEARVIKTLGNGLAINYRDGRYNVTDVRTGREAYQASTIQEAVKVGTDEDFISLVNDFRKTPRYKAMETLN
jgi:hypothetical protein